MMKIYTLIIAVLMPFAFPGIATAVPPNMAIEFSDSPMGKVTFEGAKHQAAGFKCPDCHASTFEMARTVKITEEDHQSGKACFTCHDGGKSFAAKDNCERCHKK